MLMLSVFFSLYGIAGIFGFQFAIPEKYKEKEWTKDYIRFRGISWILMGIPCFILYIIARSRNVSYSIMSLLIVLFQIPSLVYSIIGEKKYTAMLKNK